MSSWIHVKLYKNYRWALRIFRRALEFFFFFVSYMVFERKFSSSYAFVRDKIFLSVYIVVVSRFADTFKDSYTFVLQPRILGVLIMFFTFHGISWAPNQLPFMSIGLNFWRTLRGGDSVRALLQLHWCLRISQGFSQDSVEGM